MALRIRAKPIYWHAMRNLRNITSVIKLAVGVSTCLVSGAMLERVMVGCHPFNNH